MKKNYGFTLVEILTTIAIIGILSVIAVSSVMMISNSIKERTYNSKIELLSTAAELYAQDNREIFGVSTEDCQIFALDEACVRVEDLIQNNYAEIDVNKGYKNNKCEDDFGCVINPVDDSSLNKEYFLIKKIKNKINAELLGIPSIKYTLTINPGEGQWNGERIQSLSPGDEIPVEDAVKERCTFSKWKIQGYGAINNKKYTMGEGNTTLIAEYTCKNKLIIDADDGIWSGETTQYLEVGATTTINNPEKANCIFSKWDITGTGTMIGTTFTMGEENSTLTARYICNRLTIDKNGGIWSGQATQNLDAGAKITINNPTKGNCAFSKWNITGTGTMSGTTFTMGEGNTTLKAEYHCILEIPYTGNLKQVDITKSADYIIELWGGNGGAAAAYQYGASYTKGQIQLLQGDILYINVGGRGCNTYNDYCNACANPEYLLSGGWNGGGYGHWAGCGLVWGGGHPGGGGATDVRINSNSLNARIMVAAGGGGAESSSANSAGGGLANYAGNTTQIYGHSRGSGQEGSGGSYNCSNYTCSDAWWGSYPTSGSGGGYMGAPRSGYGGSSFISGHMGSIAVNSSGNPICSDSKTSATSYVGTTNTACSIHYSNKKFTSTQMIDGAGYSWSNRRVGLVQMPNPSGGLYPAGYGHRDNGYARISYVDK